MIISFLIVVEIVAIIISALISIWGEGIKFGLLSGHAIIWGAVGLIMLIGVIISLDL